MVVKILKSMSMIYNEDCNLGFDNLSQSYGKFVDVVITSPPYAEQRKNQYTSINEKDYPMWTLQWVNSCEKILKDEGSIFINIRPHIKNGVISDYVLKTRLLLRENGWKECEELIWIKPDSPPLGSICRPRRSWEHILWFSKTSKPYVDVKKGGSISSRIGFENSKFEHGGSSHIHAGQNNSKVGKARIKDYIECGTGRVEKGLGHPAMFPRELPSYLINMACPTNGIVLDPFMGSGTTMRECVNKDVGFLGFEIDGEYFNIASKSLYDEIISNGKDKQYAEYIERSSAY